MMRKRLLCAVLALALLLSAQSAAAAAEAANERSMIITATTRLPVVKVTVPTSGQVYLNPLQLPVDVYGDATTDQIISYPLTIANESDAAVQVDVRVTGKVKPESDMTLASAPTNGTGTSKSAFVYFEIKPSDPYDPYSVEWDEAYDAAKHIPVTTGGSSKSNLVTLDAVGMYGEVQGGAAFRLTGDAVKTPTNAWTAKDGIDVTIAFTFTPIPFES